jgi:octaprenyl-diphosphate synthase
MYETLTSHPEKPAFPFHLVKDELALVKSLIQEQAKSFDPAVEGYIEYVCDTSGKHIRPALAILAGGATGGVSAEHRKLGTILELIHIATLVHDDIIDGADIRRDLPTANAKWGSALSVLLGDCLFAHALMLATDFEDTTICRKISLAAAQVCSGEIMQTQRRFDLNLSKKDYFKIIAMKTAELFAVATELGARLSGANEETQLNFRNFGMLLGTAYQIYDDCLDLVGKEEIVGKTLRTDLAKGKLTLPILNLMESATKAQHAKLSKLLIQDEPFDVSVLAGIADYEGAIEGAITTAQNMLVEARDNLTGIASSEYADGLIQITQYLDALLADCKNS